MTLIARQVGFAFVLVPLAGACSASDYSRRAARSAERILEQRHEEVLGLREETAVEPELAPPPDVPEPGEAVPAPPPEPVVIDLRQALAIAYEGNRDLISRREDLHLDALSLAGTRHTYSPQLALVLGYLYGEQLGLSDTNAGSARFTASQILPTGGELSLAAATDASAIEHQSGTYGSLVTLRLAQPLLRGAGYEVSHEALVQAERDLVYSLRAFELFRENFSIDVAQRFYGLVRQKQSIDNQLRSLENSEFGLRQAQALFAVGRTSELEVLRARRDELTARNNLLEARETFELALDNFRIFLGLPKDQPIDVESDPPPFTPVHYAIDSALEVAFQNRLDLLTRHEQLEDRERRLRVTGNALLPDLDVGLQTTHRTLDGDDFGGSDLERTDLAFDVTLGVPLDRVRERNAYRAAEIAVDRERRALEQFEDELRVGILSSFRELERRLESLEIQRQLIEDQTKNLRIAELRFERGDIDNRDVVEARQSLLDAQNALIDEQVNYEIARLQLLRNLGILFVDEEGMWTR